MSATLVYSSSMRPSTENVYVPDRRHYYAASKLIDAILKERKKGRVLVERGRFSYIPADGTRKMVIRLRNL